MNLEQAKDLLLGTHLASLKSGDRAYGYMLRSPPGVGKSDGIFQYCSQLAIRINEPVGCVVMMPATLTSPDARGFMIPLKPEVGEACPRTIFSIPPWMPDGDNIFVFTPDGVMHYPGEWEGEIPEVGVVFLDEWGQADEDVRKPFAELLLNGMVGTHRLSVYWRVVGAENRVSDRSGVSRELMHIINRRCLVEIDPDLTTWLNWADDQPEGRQPHPLTRAFARKQPDIVFSPTLPDNTDPYCTPRSLCRMDRDIRILQTEGDVEHDRLPMTSLARELCAGFIGKPATMQYFTHLKFAEELPDLDDIIKTPMRAKVPTGKDAQMICAFMLADAVDDDTAQPIVRYIRRLGREMQILAMGTIVSPAVVKQETSDLKQSLAQMRRAKAVTPLPEYMEWLMENKDVLRAAQM